MTRDAQGVHVRAYQPLSPPNGPTGDRSAFDRLWEAARLIDLSRISILLESQPGFDHPKEFTLVDNFTTGDSTKRPRFTFPVIALIATFGGAILSMGCGGGGSSGSDEPAAAEDEWDVMSWDEGEWASMQRRSPLVDLSLVQAGLSDIQRS